MGSDTLAAVDRDVLSRFATCCRALGLSVHDRLRPADPAAARSGFADLTRIAHEHCDAWTGLAAAGDVSPRVVESVWRTVGTAGALQRRLELTPGDLGFTYYTGLYLQFRASNPDEFQLAHAATIAGSGDYAGADRLVGPLIERRPSWLDARWVRVSMCYRTERWSDVVRLLTPIVNDERLDETYAHAARVALGTALARLGMFAPALSYLEDPSGPVQVAGVDGALGKALALRAQGEDLDAGDVLADLYAANPEHEQVELALSDSSYGIVPTTASRIEARSDP
jgi:type VII secretion ATPase EccA